MNYEESPENDKMIIEDSEDIIVTEDGIIENMYEDGKDRLLELAVEMRKDESLFKVYKEEYNLIASRIGEEIVHAFKNRFYGESKNSGRLTYNEEKNKKLKKIKKKSKLLEKAYSQHLYSTDPLDIYIKRDNYICRELELLDRKIRKLKSNHLDITFLPKETEDRKNYRRRMMKSSNRKILRAKTKRNLLVEEQVQLRERIAEIKKRESELFKIQKDINFETVVIRLTEEQRFKYQELLNYTIFVRDKLYEKYGNSNITPESELYIKHILSEIRDGPSSRILNLDRFDLSLDVRVARKIIAFRPSQLKYDPNRDVSNALKIQNIGRVAFTLPKGEQIHDGIIYNVDNIFYLRYRRKAKPSSTKIQ